MALEVMSRQLRSCQLVDSLSTGGAERLVALQAVEMAAAGHQVDVVSLAAEVDGPVLQQLVAASLPVTHVPPEGRYSLLDRARKMALTQVVSDLEPEVVHLHLDTSIIVGSQVARRLGLPTVVTLHGSAPDFRRLAGLKKPFLNRALRLADRVVAVGPQVADTWRDAVPGLEPVVVLNPVTGIGPVVERRTVHEPAEPLEIIAVGRLVHQKSYEVLVEAMRRVVDALRVDDAAVRPVRCRIVGDGPERPMIESAIAQHGLGDDIELLGFRTDIDGLLASSDLFVSSSSSEGLPVSVLEAMAAGLPVVCTDVGDVRAAVPEGAGVVVQPNRPEALADAMLSLIKDADLRRRYGSAGRRHVVANHDPARWAARLAELYADVLDGPR